MLLSIAVSILRRLRNPQCEGSANQVRWACAVYRVVLELSRSELSLKLNWVDECVSFLGGIKLYDFHDYVADTLCIWLSIFITLTQTRLQNIWDFLLNVNRKAIAGLGEVKTE